jgi:hypothetical protein
MSNLRFSSHTSGSYAAFKLYIILWADRLDLLPVVAVCRQPF